MKTSMKTLLIAFSAMGISATAFAAPEAPEAEGDAQQANPAQEEMQQEAPSADDIDSDELEKFAKAYKDVEKIRTSYVEEAGSTDDPQEMAEVQMSMQEEMIDAVEETGLDIGTYNKIAQVLPYDEDLRNKVEDML